MILASLPPDEAERLATLRVLRILDTPPEERFDRLTRLASGVFEVPIAYISLVDANRQWLKSCQGMSTTETGRDISFCSHAILEPDTLVISDALQDPRFHDNPLVTGDPYVRFYAGQPIAVDGHNVGTVCLVDRHPRAFSERERGILREIAGQVQRELSLVDVIEMQRELLSTKEALIVEQQKLAAEVSRAAEYVRSLLPVPCDGPIRTDWRFVPSIDLGGDIFGYHWLDENRFALYLLDVSGHGVGAALLSVSVGNVLRSRTLSGVDFACPAEVVSALNNAFTMDAQDNMYFTIWYGVFDRRDRTLAYCSAAHPAAILLSANGSGAKELGTPGLMVGAFPNRPFEEARCPIPPQSALYLFSDGVYEVEGPKRGMLTSAEFTDFLAHAEDGSRSRLDVVLDTAKSATGAERFDDDVSILEARF